VRSIMTAPTAVRQIQAGADATVSGIQHVGHVVRDIETAIALLSADGFSGATAVVPRSCSASRRAAARLRDWEHAR
jgi:hypothetical protein